MRKLKKGRKFSRKKDQRKALLKSLAAALFLHEKIKTTEAKAKEISGYAEKMITKAKNNTLASKRHLAKFFPPKIVKKITNGRMADVVINCVNIPNTEMSSILMTRERGSVYFFSMATSFTKAALGAEGVGKDIDIIMGNGYMKGHSEIALDILRKSPIIRKYYQKYYA